MSKKIIIFPGQGSQKVGMGKDLFDNFISAKDVFLEVDEVLKRKLSKIIFEGSSEELTKTHNTQPALMAVSMALVRVIEKEFGKKITDLANFVAGHSLGEYSALCAINAISLKDSAKLLQIRGEAMSKCASKTKGAMAAIIGSEISEVRKIVKLANIDGEVCNLANDNSVGQIVISGSENGIKNALAIAKENGIKKTIELPVSGAFHSSLMSDAAIEMKEALDSFNINKPTLPLIANITAKQVSDPSLIKELLVKQVTGSVRWRETILEAESLQVNEFIEIGSGKVLTGLTQRTYKNAKTSSIQNIDDIKKFFSNNL